MILWINNAPHHTLEGSNMQTLFRFCFRFKVAGNTRSTTGLEERGVVQVYIKITLIGKFRTSTVSNSKPATTLLYSKYLRFEEFLLSQALKSNANVLNRFAYRHITNISAKKNDTIQCLIIGTLSEPYLGHIRAMYWLCIQNLFF